MVVQLFRRRPASAAAVSVGFFLSLLILFSLYWSATPASVGGLTSAAAGLKTTSKALINDITNATLGVSSWLPQIYPGNTKNLINLRSSAAYSPSVFPPGQTIATP